MTTAIGKDVSLSTFTIDDVLTGTELVSIDALSVEAITRAEAIWSSYMGSGTMTARAAVAAYFFALESIAEEFLRLRLGNIGAARESNVAELIVQKAMALVELSQAEIRKYEEFCANEMRVVGADTYNAMIADAYLNASTGASAVEALIGMIAMDGKTSAAFGDYATNLATGMAMQLLAGRIVQRVLGYVGARNPSLGNYYINAAQALSQNGQASVQRQIERLQQRQPQYAVQALGI